MLPLAYFGVPVAEITLTLLLSLRFVSLVFDEVRYQLITEKEILLIDKSLSKLLVAYCSRHGNVFAIYKRNHVLAGSKCCVRGCIPQDKLATVDHDGDG